MNNVNPWVGWSSYDDDSIKTGKIFAGRSSETSELFSLIDNNLLVTLYGKSGIGKTSLLNAGVFPSLKAAYYEPIICRCGESDYLDNIICQIRTHCSLSSEHDISSISNLVDLFKHTEFSKNGKSVFPVLVFDQFEDWFRLNNQCVDQLLKEINILTSNEYDGITNYRFVISIREDYLYLLEDAIDKRELNEFKTNRYRLTELKQLQTEEIFDLGEIETEVRKRILEIAKEGNGYNPGLISFFCSELYEIYPNGITTSALNEVSNENTLIERYYNRCFENRELSKNTKDYIESNLQDEGLRRPQNKKTVRKHIPQKELDILLRGRNKLLRLFPVGDEEHIELIHDRIAEIIHNHKNKQISEQRDKSIALTLCLYLIVIGFYIWSLITKIMHASWGAMSDNFLPYLQAMMDSDYNHTISADDEQLSKFLIWSQCLSYLIIIYILVISIPRLLCSYYYSRLSIKSCILLLITLSISYLLSSSLIITMSIQSNTYIFAILGWLIIYAKLIFSGISNKQKVK